MLIIPAILESFRSLKDKTYKLVFETSELTPDQLTGIANSMQQFGYMAFKNDPFKKEETDAIDNLKAEYEDTGKTPAQRLRAVIYLNWKENNEGYDDPELHYRFKMEKVISHFKKSLPEM